MILEWTTIEIIDPFAHPDPHSDLIGKRWGVLVMMPGVGIGKCSWSAKAFIESW